MPSRPSPPTPPESFMPNPERSAYADLTDAVAEATEAPPAGQRFVRDVRLPGFALRVTSGGVKSWTVEGRMRGAATTKRRTIGRFPAVKADRARTLAMQELGRFAEGIDRLNETRAKHAKTITLGTVFTDYLATKTLKPVTVVDYKRAFNTTFDDWREKQITSITRTMVELRHKKITAASPARANLAMRLLRALFNFAAGKYETPEGEPVILDNPIKRLSATGAWNRLERRRRLVRLHQMPGWYDALENIRGRSERGALAADWIEFLVLTGCRRTESKSLTWNNVDIPGRIFRLPDTKNREVHEMPLSDRLLEIMTRCRARAPASSEFVFAAAHGRMKDEGYWVKQMVLVGEVPFSPHDLRRTFATVAEGLDIPVYTIKRLMNHVSGSGDVTAGYIQIDVERMRVPMQRITDAILTAAGRKGAPATVVDIQSARR